MTNQYFGFPFWKLIACVYILYISFLESSFADNNKKVDESKKMPFSRFSERLRISYFGILTSPPLKDMSRGQWNNAAIAPSMGLEGSNDHSNHDTWPTNLWNQISFNYNYGYKLNFVVNPRFTIPLVSPVSMKSPEDKSQIVLEDAFVGFQGVVKTSENKKFNLFLRFGERLPISRLSRNSNNAGFGKISKQIEFSYNPTYDLSPKWQISMIGVVRQWVYEDRYNLSRIRFFNAPYIQYTLDDKTRFLAYYEHMIENNKRWKSINGKEPVYKDVLQNLLLGVNRSLNEKTSIFPFVACYVDDAPISTESVWFGMWISYRIK